MQWVYFGLLGLVLIIAAVVDLRRHIVPNRLTIPAICVGLMLHGADGLVHNGAEGLADGLIVAFGALLVGLIPMAIVFFAGGLGGGDVKLVAAIGAITGSWTCVLAAVFYSFVFAAVIALFLMFRHRIVKRTLQRILGAALTAYGRSTPEIPTDSPKVPFALALCFGGLLAAVEYLLGVSLPWS